MILEEMRSCLEKLEPGFRTYNLIRLLSPSCPKLVFRTQTPDVTALGSKLFFMLSSIKFCMKRAPIVKFWIIFDKVTSVYSQKIGNKTIKNLLFGAIPDT